MQKIKLAILEKMIESKITSKEVDFIINISKYQDESGVVTGVYYKDICQDLDMSNQKFYDVKASLIEKGIIRAEKEYYSDWNIKICDNDFTNPETYKEGYINTNHDIFSDKEFFSLKAGEKLLAMQFLKICHAGRGSYNIGTENFFKKYTKLFGVTKRVLRNYLKSLKAFFSIGIKEHQYWITPLTKVYRKIGATSEAENYNMQYGKTLMRREKIKEYSEKALKDTVALIKQYKDVFRENILNVLADAIHKSIVQANYYIKNECKWKRILQPKLIHKLIRDQIPAY